MEEHEYYQLLNINKISQLTNINKDKLYNNMKGKQDTLTDDQKLSITKLITQAVENVNNTILAIKEKEGE